MSLWSQYKIKTNHSALSDISDWYYGFLIHILFSSTTFNLFLWHFEALVINLNLWYKIVFKVKQIHFYISALQAFAKNANITKETTKATMNTPWYIIL